MREGTAGVAEGQSWQQGKRLAGQDKGKSRAGVAEGQVAGRAGQGLQRQEWQRGKVSGSGGWPPQGHALALSVAGALQEQWQDSRRSEEQTLYCAVHCPARGAPGPALRPLHIHCNAFSSASTATAWKLPGSCDLPAQRCTLHARQSRGRPSPSPPPHLHHTHPCNPCSALLCCLTLGAFAAALCFFSCLLTPAVTVLPAVGGQPIR